MYWKYFKYVLRHKWYVFVECCKLWIPFRGLVHDLSKLLPSEFKAYARYYCGPQVNIPDWKKSPVGELLSSSADMAWLKHQNRNKHHWQYWVLTRDSGGVVPLPIPEKYVLEMIADWRASGKSMKNGVPVKDWYLDHKECMILHSYTREYIESILCT